MSEYRFPLLAIALSLSACGGGGTSSTLPREAASRGLSESETRALSVLPAEIVGLTRFDVERLRHEPLTELQVASLEEAVPFARSVRRMYVAIGDYGPLASLCLDGPLTPRSGGCPVRDADDPDAERDASAEYDEYDARVDEADALRTFRRGPERQVFAFYVVFEATPEACAQLVGEAVASNGRRVRTESGASLVDFGEGVCAFTSSDLVDRVRPASAEVVAAAAKALRIATPSLPETWVELAIAPDRIAPFYESYARTNANFVPRVDIALRSRLVGLRTIALSVASRPESYGVSFALRYEQGEQPIGSEALVQLVQDVYAAFRASGGSLGEDADSWIANIQVERTEHDLALDIPLRSDMVRELLRDTLRTMSRATDVDIPSESDPAPPDEATRWLAALADELAALRADEALARIDRAIVETPSRHVSVLRVLAMRRIVFLGASGRFDEALRGLQELARDGLCPSGVFYGQEGAAIGHMEADALHQALTALWLDAPARRNDVEALVAIAEMSDADREAYDCLDAHAAFGLATPLSRALAGRPDESDPAGPIANAYDRAPIPARGISEIRLFALLRARRFDEVWAIVHHDEQARPGMFTRGTTYAIAAIETGHASVLLEADEESDESDDEESTYDDEEDSPEPMQRWIYRHFAATRAVDAAWVRCRAERRGRSDAAAIDTCQVALTRAIGAFGPVHPDVARAHVELGEALLGARRAADARAQGRLAVAALATVHPSHPLIAAARRLAR